MRLLQFILAPLAALFRGRAEPTRRAVYEFRIGEIRYSVDPLRIKCALDKELPTWAVHCEKLAEADRALSRGLKLSEGLARQLGQRRDDLAADLVRASRTVFGLQEYGSGGPGTGATDAEALDVLAGYLEYVAAVMEATRPLATAPPSTVSAARGSPNSSASASPSTPNGSGTSASAPSPAPSAAPSAKTTSEPVHLSERDIGGEG